MKENSSKQHEIINRRLKFISHQPELTEKKVIKIKQSINLIYTKVLNPYSFCYFEILFIQYLWGENKIYVKSVQTKSE